MKKSKQIFKIRHVQSNELPKTIIFKPREKPRGQKSSQFLSNVGIEQGFTKKKTYSIGSRFHHFQEFRRVLMHLPVLIESLECCRFEFIKVQLVCVHPHVQAVGGIEIFNEGRQAVVL